MNKKHMNNKKIDSAANTPQGHQTVRPPAPYHEKLSKLDEPDMQGHCWRSRDETHKRCTLMDPHTWPRKMQDDQLERTFSSYVRIQVVVRKTYLGRWNDREEWRERVRDIRAASTIWWWWWKYKKWYSNLLMHLILVVNSDF